MPLISAARVVTATAVHSPGWIDTRADGTVVAVGSGVPPRTPDADLGAATVVPGFVDMHVHGGGGGDYTDLDEASVRRARAAHFAHGTTTSMASLVAADPQRLRTQVDLLSGLVREGVVDGIHLEGPWISPDRCGAHDPAALRAPDGGELADLLARADGTIRMITFAPELPGALDAIRQTVDAGSIAAVGHTDASYEQVAPAVDAGATVATHLFNAMRPIHHRDPGPVVALLGDPRVTIEMIADGTHLHPELYRHALDAAGAHRVALVTDAMAAAALGDGQYTLGELRVEVRDAVARIAGTDTIAGSTTTMDALFRAAVHAGGGLDGPDPDAALTAAVRQTATTPAHAIGWAHVGDLAPGLRADFVVLDESLRVTRVHAAEASGARL
ncbi:N-acetylglucosamine-6-phosphate deacetylase [Microbacterium mangrovi]|uniref:N-acetylglucosamine-6-phosphate deacetylase n=1 Tax=Microbacterium mangrovi TaxID=1348253 RepID=A0A0B2AAG6_9MICO|nr:N-acetylglucosamine-6-phosphate deacetylase [Microbacterium mangrovi]KHK98611.1 N-acetylglucosamine-6-phosphate deacetylase [Microbacterium mangrovi]